jgi:putative lumazine-binding protein
MGVETEVTEEAAIAEAVQHYFTAVATNDPAELARAFHPDCVMQSVQHGALVQVTQGQWQERMRTAGGAPPAATRRVESIEIDGTMAAVKARATFATFEFVDRLVLLKVGGRWQIVAKAFHRAAK